MGLPLARQLVRKGHEVYGTTTSREKIPTLQNAGIVPCPIVLKTNGIEGDIQGFLASLDVLIINVPPGLRKRNNESFIGKMRRLHTEIRQNTVRKLIFVSSTSVYGASEGEITEDTVPRPETESAKQLWASEQLFTNNDGLHTAIIRFGGLIGPNRHPVTMLSKKEGLTNGQDPVNLIHLEDAIHMIGTILTNEYWNELFNGVYPLHPPKKEYYLHEAVKRGLPAPRYSESPLQKKGKIVKSKNFLDKSHQFRTSIVS